MQSVLRTWGSFGCSEYDQEALQALGLEVPAEEAAAEADQADAMAVDAPDQAAAAAQPSQHAAAPSDAQDGLVLPASDA